MNVNVTNESGYCRIGIEGEMTIYNAAQLKDALLMAMTEPGQLEMNLGQVSEIDTAGLQLLALAKREAADNGQTLHFVAHSQAVLNMLDMCNLESVFGDPVVISPA